MAKKVITKKARISVAKKRWYQIQAPKIFNEVVFAETLAQEPESLVGRSVRANISNVLRMGKKQSGELLFRIIEVKGSICYTKLEGMEVLPPHVKRIVKRARSRVDDSFVVETKDGIKVRLKPMILVKDKVQHGVLTSLRKGTQDFFGRIAQETEYDEFISRILMGELYKDVKSELKKIFPVIAVEMRAFTRL